MARRTVLLSLVGVFLCCTFCIRKNASDRMIVASAQEPESVPVDVTPPAPPEPTTVAAVPTAHVAAPTELQRRIEEAKRMLKDVRMPTTATGGDNAVLAIWDPSTRGAIRLVTLLGGMCRSPECDVQVRIHNGVNSLYKVNAPQNHVVIALKMNVHNPKQRHLTMPAIYVPYSPELRTPEIVAAGREYLSSIATRGSETMNDFDVRSLVHPDKRPTDIVPARILMTLLVVEHEDPSDFDRDGVEMTAGKVLTGLATNRDDAYRYAVSYAGAQGLAQFMKSTYEAMRARYPRANLPANFSEGMTDHVAAVRAQYCLADWSVAQLPPSIMDRLLRPGNEENLGAYLAAAYNGGEVRAAQALAANPAHWESSGYGLFAQTVKYVQIFRATYRYLFP